MKSKSSPIIQLKDLTKVYNMGENQFKALKKINLEIHEGEFIAIMGPSGSGKSTLMNIIGFLDVATKGKYKFNGKEVSKYKEEHLADLRGSMIGFIFQMFHLLPRMSALENVRLPLIYSEASEEEQINRAKEVLKKVGLGDKMVNQPNELSGGQQQRVAIARALANKPKILLADEPTGNLDSSTSKEIIKILKKLHKEGHTLIIVTHEESMAKLAKRIITIKDGHIIQDKTRR